MNLLVTNTRNAQAYSIIRALRPHAQKIVATMEGDNRLAARLSHAANSRLVDKRYYTPFPADDWRAGRIQRENTKTEESYIRTVLQICDAEQIDTIFPSFDPQIYIFSKNKRRFEESGILIPIPDYETTIIPLDKYRTILAAQDVGFPCPKTYLPETENDLMRIVAYLGFPLVVKPRFTSGGRGTAIVRNLDELSAKMRRSWCHSPNSAMVQEYIPGTEKQQFYFMFDKAGELKMSFCSKTLRLVDRMCRNSSAASELSPPHPKSSVAASVARRLGWWGGITLQTKVDPRDGLPKLLETSPRLGHQLWYRSAVAINEPLMCLQIARELEVTPIENYPVGTMFLSPIEDVLSFGFGLLDRLVYTVKTRLFAASSLDPLSVPPSCGELLRSYRETYFTDKSKVFDPYFTYSLRDPVVSLLWWLEFSYLLMAATKHLGR
jgi:predicted ATP-grasp superfamily ATP-dependent carboligase